MLTSRSWGCRGHLWTTAYTECFIRQSALFIVFKLCLRVDDVSHSLMTSLPCDFAAWIMSFAASRVSNTALFLCYHPSTPHSSVCWELLMSTEAPASNKEYAYTQSVHMIQSVHPIKSRVADVQLNVVLLFKPQVLKKTWRHHVINYRTTSHFRQHRKRRWKTWQYLV